MITILLIIAGYFVVKALFRVLTQYKHLSDEDIQDLMRNRLDRNGSEYGRIIKHLGLCEDCQNRLHNFEKGRNLEDHLIEESD